MIIVNGVNIDEKYKTNVQILDYLLQQREVVTYTDWLDGAFDITIHKNNKYKAFEICISMLLSCSSMDACELVRSELLNTFKSGTIQFDDMSITYDFVFKSEEIMLLNKWRYSYKLTLTAYNKKGKKQTINFTGTEHQFTAKGTADTPAVLSVSSNIGLNSLTITGLTSRPITINNIAINTPIVIDGEQCTVEENGGNIFGRTDLWEFPVIKPGINTIKLSSSCTCELSYKPRYL